MVINPPIPTLTGSSSQRLRAGMTDAERQLWQYLRAGRLEGFKFHRQHPVPPYIVDFVCLSAALVVQLDDSQHIPEIDSVRSRHLVRRGLRVLRFSDRDVLLDMEAVVDVILSEMPAEAVVARGDGTV